MTTHRIPFLALTVVGLFMLFQIPILAADDESKGGEPFSIGVYLGPSIPSESIEQIYDSIDTTGIGAAYETASSLGYHLGAKLRFGLSDAFSFSGGIQYTQFPGQDQTAVLDNGTRIQLQTVTTYVPVYAGITFIPMQGLFRPYLSTELMYSYRNVSVSEGNSIFENLITGTGQDLEPQTSRFGAAVTGGLELNLGGLRPFLEMKYNWTNLVGKEDGEEMMSFLNVSIGLVF